MTRLNTVDKLNRMYEIFTTNDDKKLNPGETEALAGFFRGLPEAGRAKIRERMVEIYRGSKFDAGTRERFMKELVSAGLTLKDLEGQSGDTGASVLKMSKAAQLERLRALDCGETGGSEGYSKEIRAADVARDARATITTDLKARQKDIQREHHGQAELADPAWRAIYREEGAAGRGKELVGYAVELPVYADDHDVDQTFYFNVKGACVGQEYSGE